MTFGAPRSLPLAISTQKTQVALSKNRPEGGIFILPLPVIDCLADEPHLGRACQDDSISSTSTPSLSPASSSTVATSDSESDPFEGPICPTAHTVATPHTEFGVCTNTAFRTRSAHLTGEPQPSHIKRDPPYFITATTYLSYLILVAFAHLRELVGKWFRPGRYRHLMPHDVSRIYTPFWAIIPQSGAALAQRCTAFSAFISLTGGCRNTLTDGVVYYFCK